MRSGFRKVLLNAPIRILLVCSSIIICLAFGEALVRIFYPQVTPSEYVQRYLIDGQPSFTEGFFVNDSILPYALKPNYRHTVADCAWAPKPFYISLDAHGYRNSHSDDDVAAAVFVGDSVTFGWGVNEQESLPAQLGTLIQQKVYNLGVPGAGPASYMVMLERYLKFSPAPGLIIIGFYDNDFTNLSLASWQELAYCGSPASRIYRDDVPPKRQVYPVWVTTSFLKYSHLVTFLVNLATVRGSETLWGWAQTHQIFSKRAINALKLANPSPQGFDGSINKALGYAAELEKCTCLTKSEQNLLKLYKAKMYEENWREAYPIAAKIADSLINRDCNPIHKGQLVNNTSYFNYYSGFYWRMMDEHAPGYITAYDHLLDDLEDNPAFKDFAPTFSIIQEKLRALDTSLEADISSINYQLNQWIENPFAEIPVGCDKLDVFLERVRILAATHGSNLLIVIIPPEYRLRDFRDSEDMNHSRLRDRASQYQIPCLDLVPNFVKHYSEADTALYLDGAHLNTQGNMLASQWIYEWIREHEG
jgi:lysophospholipase L1-like esterase